MQEKVLMKGNEAIAEAAILAGCRHYLGYPITPQTEVAAYMAKKMPKIGGTFLQAESEIAAINMVYGVAATGKRAMTSSSSPGIALKCEGISYLAGADLPAVIVNVQRGGPGLGGIQPSQSDYFLATRGPGHGDFHVLVLAPASVQEMADLTGKAFDLAEKYRMPAIQLTDDAKNLLLTYRWPGNIRQLKNVTEQISIFETSREVSADIIKSYLPSYNVERLPVVSGSEGKDGFLFGNEREMLYQIIFEMRKEMNELKSIVDNLAASENGHGLKVYTPEHNTAITHPTVPVVKTFHIDKESTEDVHDESVFEETSLSLEDAEKEMIRKSLERNNGKRKKTAEELKISERTLYRKIKEYNLE